MGCVWVYHQKSMGSIELNRLKNLIVVINGENNSIDKKRWSVKQFDLNSTDLYAINYLIYK